MNKYQYSKGVSLIELLVVIAIIGIFAALGTQGYRSIVSDSDFIANRTALNQYLNDIRYKAYADNKHYKIRMRNFNDNLTVELFEPEETELVYASDPCAGSSPEFSSSQCLLTGLPLNLYQQVDDTSAQLYSKSSGNLNFSIV